MWLRAGGGGCQSMWIILKFYDTIIKFANVDKERGGKTLIHQMWIKIRFFLKNPSLKRINYKS